LGRLMEKSIYAEHDGKPIPLLVDIGYIGEAETKERHDAILAYGIGRGNFSVEGFNRLFVEIPPRKAEKFLDAFPVVPGETYFRATHHWNGLSKDD